MSLWSAAARLPAARLPPPRALPARPPMVKLASVWKTPRPTAKPARPLANVAKLRSVFSRRKPL